MREFQTRKQIRHILAWPLVICLLVAVLWVSYAAIREYAGVRDARAARAKVERELAEINQKRDTLENKMQELSSDTGMEKVLKERLNVVKPGEHLLVVVKDSGSANAKNSEGGGGFFSSWWTAIKRIF
ncbi:MAG: septum formation initiator family protein [Patescibacteria group bacterium]